MKPPKIKDFENVTQIICDVQGSSCLYTDSNVFGSK